MSLRVSLNSRVWNFMFFKFMYSFAIPYLYVMPSDGVLPAVLSYCLPNPSSQQVPLLSWLHVRACVRAYILVVVGVLLFQPQEAWSADLSCRPALMGPSFGLFVGIHSFSGCQCSLWLKRNIFSQHRQLLSSWWKWRKCAEALVNPTIWELGSPTLIKCFLWLHLLRLKITYFHRGWERISWGHTF